MSQLLVHMLPTGWPGPDPQRIAQDEPRPGDEPPRRRRLYLAGPMSGLPEHNYPAFHAAAVFYESQGYEVENPANNVVTNPHEGEQLWAAFMRLSIPQMLRCDCVVALDGWEQSRGAVLELYLARQLGIPCFAHHQLQETFLQHPMEVQEGE